MANLRKLAGGSACRCNSLRRPRLKRNEGNAGEITCVSPGVPGEDAAARDGGMSADEKIGEDITSISSRAPIFQERPPGEKERCARDLVEQKSHFRSGVIQCIDGFEHQ